MVVARVIGTGDAKYADWDWLGRSSRDDIRGALGHIFEYLDGREVDPESGESPIAHAAARLCFVLERIERGVIEEDDFRIPREDEE